MKMDEGLDERLDRKSSGWIARALTRPRPVLGSRTTGAKDGGL